MAFKNLSPKRTLSSLRKKRFTVLVTFVDDGEGCLHASLDPMNSNRLLVHSHFSSLSCMFHYNELGSKVKTVFCEI